MSDMSEPQRLRALFINNLHHECTEAALKSHFEKFGEIVNCSIKKDPITGISRGFGFVTFKRAHMVDDAQAARPHKIDGRLVKSKRLFPLEQSNNPGVLGTVNALYVHGITEDISEEDLRECFKSYGKIVSVKIVIDKETGKRRGFAFVEFDDYDPVDKIVLYTHECKGHKLNVGKAISREVKECIQMRRGMPGIGRGLTNPRLWRESDGYGVGGDNPAYGRGYVGGHLPNHYGNSYPFGRGCVGNVGYGYNYPNGRGCGPWRGTFRSSFGRIPVQGNIGYAKQMQGHNYGGQAPGQHGPR